MDNQPQEYPSSSLRRDEHAARLSFAEPQGHIRPHGLDELWFHTGTACNLACPFCLEGSKPGDDRLQLLRLRDAVPFIEEALTLGVKQFSFTGGEPFINKDIIPILAYALQYRPCLVLTNGTEPLLRRINQLEPLLNCEYPLSFRVSLDFPDPVRHDSGRGQGMFASALAGLRKLHEMGFNVSLASQLSSGESGHASAAFADILSNAGLPATLPVVEFPEFHPPGTHVSTPRITENCLATYQTDESRDSFMCAFSKMVAKTGGRMKVYACTLVDDDPEYILGETLADAMQMAVPLKHHRCYSCFRYGASCSEMNRGA